MVVGAGVACLRVACWLCSVGLLVSCGVVMIVFDRCWLVWVG